MGWRGALFLGLAMVLGLLARLAILSNPIHTLFASGFLIDDAFYYASFARELSAGRVLELAPGEVSSGVQPLFAILTAPAWWWWEAGSEEAVRFGLTLSALASVATAFLLARWAARLGAGASALAVGAVWALGPMSIFYSLNGMETALALCLATAIGAYWPALLARPVALGILYGMTVLARCDALLLAPLLAALATTRWSVQSGRAEVATRVARATAAFLAVVAPVVWVYGSHTGHLLPQSGSAVRTLTTMPGPPPDLFFAPDVIAAHVRAAFAALGSDLLQQILAVPPSRIPTLLPALLFTAVLVLIVAVQTRLRPRRAARPAALAAGLIVLYVAAYAAWVGAPWAYGRYLHGGVLLLLLVLATLCDLDRLARRRWGRAIAFLLLLVYGAFGLGKIDGVLIAPRWSAREDASLIRFVEDRVAAGERVGMFQSGRLGYRTRGAVVNLDGVVNAEAAHALATGTLATYLRDRHVAWIVDEPRVLENLLFRAPRSVPFALEPEREGYFSAYRIRFDVAP